jgi:DNA-binding NtrC family response regulator
VLAPQGGAGVSISTAMPRPESDIRQDRAARARAPRGGRRGRHRPRAAPLARARRLRVHEARDEARLRAELAREPEIVLLDLRLGQASGLELLGELRARCPDAETVVMTGYASIDSAVECMRAGAFDYLEKPFTDPRRVLQTLARALERRRLRVRNRELEGELDRRSALERVIAHSPAMKRVLQTVRDLAGNESTVLIEGESGTGKELIARAIHETSPRSRGAFVPVDCGALPEGLIESELFGHVRGAFTGATRDSAGLIRSAHGGTLFLDEIGELPLPLQVKLLRAIQEREVRPLGAIASEAVDVRIVAATNRDLAAEVRAGRFRAIISACAWSRSRCRHAIGPRTWRCWPATSWSAPRPARRSPASSPRRSSGCSRTAGKATCASSRTRSKPRSRSRRARASPPRSAFTTRARTPVPEGIDLSLDAFERACREEALRRSQSDVRAAAAMLGIGRSTFYRKMLQHGLRGT